MIYYKKKSLARKFINFVQEKAHANKAGVFCVFKTFLILFLLLVSPLYLLFLFGLPQIINEQKAETIINNYVLDKTKLKLDIENFSIKPSYNLKININANKINLKYKNNKDFIVISSLNTDINLISLLFNFIDIDKLESKSITINSNFNKNETYDCFKYLDFKNSTESKIKLRKINLNSNNFILNIYDENIKKTFQILAYNLAIKSYDSKKPVFVKTKGVIKSSNHKISDFDLDLNIKINPNSINNLKNKLLKLNYNPLKYADFYKFYSNTKIDLKINTQTKKPIVVGTIHLKDYSFIIDNLFIPKNDLLLNFKEGKVSCNADFNFIKNQKIKISMLTSFNKNKNIEATFISNDLNLADLHSVLNTIYKIFNLKISSNEVQISGKSKFNIYLKSNFKTLYSKGKIIVKDALIKHKKTNLVIKNINADVNLSNNTIKISNASAFINNAKFNLVGNIDSNTNLDIKISSEPIDISQIATLLKDIFLPFDVKNNLKKYQFKKGLLKINSSMKGKIQKPIFNSNSVITDLKIFVDDLKSDVLIKNIVLNINQNDSSKNNNVKIENLSTKMNNIPIFIQKLQLNLDDKNIIIPKTTVSFEKLPIYIDGQIKNYISKQSETILNLESNLPKNNNLFVIDEEYLKLKSVLNLKQNKLLISSFNIFTKGRVLVNASGNFSDILSNAKINSLQINIIEKIKVKLPKINNSSFELKGNIVANGNLKKPDIVGKLIFNNVVIQSLDVYLKSLSMNIKNSVFYLDIIDGKIQDYSFDMNLEGEIFKDKLDISFLNFQSNYINLDNFNKYISNNFSQDFDVAIKNIKGNISTLEAQDFIFNTLIFEGSYKDNTLYLNKFNSDILNGKIDGSICVNFFTQKIKTELILKEINVRLLSKKLQDLSIAASGKVSALINSEFYGFDLDKILKTFDGYIKFNIDNGELAQFAKLERFLQAGNILSQSILKLTLNSTLSALTKQNTGDFKTIEGTLKVKSPIANIQYINTQGSNMSLNITGKFNILNQFANLKILGRIPSSMISVMGNIGQFSLDEKVEKMDEDKKEIIKSLTTSPFEKILSINIDESEINKIPSLAYYTQTIPTREFIVYINGLIDNLNSINNFKWINKN